MNPIILASFILSVLVTLICLGIALFSDDQDRQSGGCVVGFTALILAIACGIAASQQWDKTHPTPTVQVEKTK